MRHRYLFWSLSLMFGLFAALQYNDPDPHLWVTLYLLPAAVMAWAALRPLPRWLPLLLAVVYAGLAVWWWPARFDGLTGAMSPGTTVEEGREALGLLICATALLVAAWLGSSSRSAPASA
ncbi:transmembrane 220 family protein [Hymenobacter koreensis]|uniref:Transmembrane 220 family protein n=1 Tax=Hymenobacter koreensis TaxID=1084523 RepID=A0ABP8IZ01_9BACT